jgi:hypothetical protein
VAHQICEHLAAHADPVHQHHRARRRGIAATLRHDARAAVCENLDAPGIGGHARDLVDRAIDGIRQLRDCLRGGIHGRLGRSVGAVHGSRVVMRGACRRLPADGV